MDEREEYTAIMRKEIMRYESTPPWRVLHRTRQMGRVRTAAADLAYAGGNPNIPKPARHDFVQGVKSVWAWFVNVVVLDWPGFLMAILATIAAVFTIIYFTFSWMATWGSPPKPLPQGIVQRGYSFIIPAGYAQTAAYENADVSDLCHRLPDWYDERGNDDRTIKSRPDGSIVITCVLDQD